MRRYMIYKHSKHKPDFSGPSLCPNTYSDPDQVWWMNASYIAEPVIVVLLGRKPMYESVHLRIHQTTLRNMALRLLRVRIHLCK